MQDKVGIWVDHKKAVLVHFTASGHEIKQVKFKAGKPLSEGRVAARNKSHGRLDWTADDKIQNKAEVDRKGYYRDIIAATNGCMELFVFGPAQAKTELKKQLLAKKVPGLVLDVAAADDMTEAQIAATARAHFASKEGGLKPTPRRKKAPKSKKVKAVNPTEGKPTKVKKKIAVRQARKSVAVNKGHKI